MNADEPLFAEPRDGRRLWLVVRTKPKQERVAARHLGQRLVEPYCPLFLEPPWHLRAPRGPVPLFSGYLFVRCVPRLDLDRVRYCPGVLRPVAFGDRLAAVDEAFVRGLRELEGERGYIEPQVVHRRPRRGQRVRIMSGPLRGLEGVFDGYLRGGDRARVLVEFLRSRRPVEVEALAVKVCSG